MTKGWAVPMTMLRQVSSRSLPLSTKGWDVILYVAAELLAQTGELNQGQQVLLAQLDVKAGDTGAAPHTDPVLPALVGTHTVDEDQTLRGFVDEAAHALITDPAQLVKEADGGDHILDGGGLGVDLQAPVSVGQGGTPAAVLHAVDDVGGAGKDWTRVPQ